MINAADSGERITVAKVKKAISFAKQPTKSAPPAKSKSRDVGEISADGIINHIIALFRQLDWDNRSKLLARIDRLYIDWGVERP